MYTVFLIGNIASGKSRSARYLERRGALRIDLDELAKSLYQPGSEVVKELAEAFGWDVIAPDGGIDRAALARHAFATPEDTARLNAIVHPRLLEQLGHRLLPAACCSVSVPEHELAVVEVSAAAALSAAAFGLADRVIAVTAPLEVRRKRAIGRGMGAEDFDRRAAVQPSEAALASLATDVIDNAVPGDGLYEQIDRLLAGHMPAAAAGHAENAAGGADGSGRAEEAGAHGPAGEGVRHA